MPPWLRKSFAYFPVRLGLAIGLAWFTAVLPQWLKGLAWLGVLALAVWAFFAWMRDLGRALDFLEPRIGRFLRRTRAWSRKRKWLWRGVDALCVVVLASVIITEAWPSWSFMATSSLREDETMNVASYTSKGFVPAISTYSLARNHIFFNVVNAFIPGSDSTVPLRARFISFLAVLGTLVLLTVYSGRRGWLIAGCVCAGLLAVNPDFLKVVLEARGYGLLTLFATLQCVALTEWMRTGSQRWLGTMAVACVLGAYTLPFYIVVGGMFLLIAYFSKPSRETLVAGILSLSAIILLYLPVASALWKVATNYKDNYDGQLGANFTAGDAVLRILAFFIPGDVVAMNSLVVAALIAILALFMLLPRPGLASDRRAATAIFAILVVFLAFCFLQKSPPIRIAAFLAAPLAFLSAMALGSALAMRELLAFRPVPQVALAVVGIALIWKTDPTEALVPQQNWRQVGALIDTSFPGNERLWVAGRYNRLLEWNLHPRRSVEKGPMDWDALKQGRLIAVEGFFKNGDMSKRWTLDEIPDGVRFVTVPLLVNYQRVYFTPPDAKGIVSISAAGRPVSPEVGGFQPHDPFTLARSRGTGDWIYTEDDWRTGSPVAVTRRTIANPAPLELPVKLNIQLADGALTCSVLFSQTLDDKSLTAHARDSKGNFAETSVHAFGELAVISVPHGCREVSLDLARNLEYRPLIPMPQDATRPPFGVIDAWTCP